MRNSLGAKVIKSPFARAPRPSFEGRWDGAPCLLGDLLGDRWPQRVFWWVADAWAFSVEADQGDVGWNAPMPTRGAHRARQQVPTRPIDGSPWRDAFAQRPLSGRNSLLGQHFYLH